MEKICTKCGSEYSKDIKFCLKCGNTLIEKTAENIQQNERSQSTNPQPQMQTFKSSRPVQFKKTSSIEKMLIPAVIIAIILSIAAIALPFVLEESNIASNSVGTNQIANNSVTGGKIKDGTITDDDFSNIGISKIAANSITTLMILDGTIDISDLSESTIQDLSGLVLIENNSITGTKILDGSINTADINNNAITSEKITDGTITSLDIGSGQVNTSDIADNSVTYNKMSIKIKYGTKTGAVHGTTVSHGLGVKPTSVILTPVYNASIIGGNYSIYANVYSISSSSFTIGLWVITTGSNPTMYEINDADPDFTSGVNVNWIAIV